jgi:hypothetical protein
VSYTKHRHNRGSADGQTKHHYHYKGYRASCRGNTFKFMGDDAADMRGSLNINERGFVVVK